MKKRQPKPKSILYYPIARIATADLQEVFRLTQVSNELSGADVTKVQWDFHPHRSMMVGDLIENDSGIFRCEPSGWQHI